MSTIIDHTPETIRNMSSLRWRHRRNGCLAVGCLLCALTVAGIFYGGNRLITSLQYMHHALIPVSNTTLTTEFRCYAEKKQQVGKLILLERRSMEEIIRTITTQYALPGLPQAGISSQATVSIRCPVNLIYYVDLQEKWDFRLSGKRLEVMAPPIRIAPPSIDPGRIERNITGGWLVFGEAAQLAALEKELLVTLRLRAMREENLAPFRNDCRQALEKFIRNWMMNSPHQIKTIAIRFNGEMGKVQDYTPKSETM